MQIAVTQRGGAEVRKLLEALSEAVEPIAWHKRWGVRVRDQARRNARAKGGRRFWRAISDSVALGQVSRVGATVYADHVAAAQKQYGGTIEATTAKMLTIPIADRAKGKRAGEFETRRRKLFVWTSDKGNAILGYANGDELVPLYVLKKRVTQDAEPWWPTNEEMGAMGVSEGLRMLESAR